MINRHHVFLAVSLFGGRILPTQDLQDLGVLLKKRVNQMLRNGESPSPPEDSVYLTLKKEDRDRCGTH